MVLFKVLGWLWALDGSREREWTENTRAREFIMGTQKKEAQDFS